jgi:pilus assembly protein CpaE
MAQAAKLVAEKTAPRLVALVADEVTREAASRAAAQLGWTDAVVKAGGIAKAGRAIDGAHPPSVLLVDIADEAEPDAAIGDLARRCGPGTRVLAIGTANDVTLFRRLVLRGVSDYLLKPVSSEVLADALRRAVRNEADASDQKRRARVHAVIGARGGVGASTLCLGLGWVFNKEHKIQTALVDLDLHFGNLPLSVDLEPGRGLRQALEHPERTDGLLLASAMVKDEDGMPILAGEEPLEDLLHFEADGANALMDALAQDYDCLLVDLPRTLDGAARHVLATADAVVVVTDLSLSALRDAFRIKGLVKTLGGPDAITVANQVGALHRGEIGRAEFERGLGMPLDFVIPFDAKAARTMAVSGKALPAVDSAGKAAAEVRRIAARLSGREVKEKTGWRKWLR